MEQSLGKRISMYRKSKGLTQDKLAEQLGITAQAISKWENDQSCPDITMLPKLAEIFEISTDELLGCPVQRVLQGEVVDETAGEETEKDKNLWELNWDPGKRIGIAFAVLVLLVGGLLLGIIEIFCNAYISTELSNAIVFAVLIVVLLVKPRGLLGKQVHEKV